MVSNALSSRILSILYRVAGDSSHLIIGLLSSCLIGSRRNRDTPATCQATWPAHKWSYTKSSIKHHTGLSVTPLMCHLGCLASHGVTGVSLCYYSSTHATNGPTTSPMYVHQTLIHKLSGQGQYDSLCALISDIASSLKFTSSLLMEPTSLQISFIRGI